MGLDFKERLRNGPMSDRLRKLGYRQEEVYVEGKMLIRMISPSGRVWLTGGNMSYPMNSHTVYELANNKQYSYALANALNITTPRSVYVSHAGITDELRDLLKDVKKVIVKPLDSYQSKGLTLNITDESQLSLAIDHALREAQYAIVQEFIEGEEYRFSVLDGQVVSVLRRERPQVVGDGVATIAQLVEDENRSRSALPDTMLPYPQWTHELVGDVVNSSEILNSGEVRLLSSTTLVSKGASVYELIDKVHSSYRDAASHFATEIGAGFVAIDMFILDHTTHAASDNYRFNECNASPSLKMYLAPRNRTMEHIIDQVVNMTDKYLNKT